MIKREKIIKKEGLFTDNNFNFILLSQFCLYQLVITINCDNIDLNCKLCFNFLIINESGLYYNLCLL